MSHESPTPPADAAIAEPAAPAPAKPERAVARFQAEFLHALEPIIRINQACMSRFSIQGLIVEPDPEGGVFLIATTGEVMAVIRDPSGRASRPMRITIDDATFARVRPPSPVSMWAEGETFEIPLPEWAHPGVVMAWDLSCMIFPRMHLPGEDPKWSPLLAHSSKEDGNVHAGGYRIHDEPPTIPWRTALTKTRSPDMDGRAILLTEGIAAFAGIQRLYDTGLQFDIGGRQDAIIISAPGHPEFIGAVMQAKGQLADDPVPAWARA